MKTGRTAAPKVKITEVCWQCSAGKPATMRVTERTPKSYQNAKGTVRYLCTQCDTRMLGEFLDNCGSRAALVMRREFVRLIRQARLNARARGLLFEITSADLAEQWIKQSGLCAVTGLEMSSATGHAISIDRLVGDEGYSKHNFHLVCAAVNWMRGTMSLDELRYWAAHIVVGLAEQDEDEAA